MPSPCFLDLSGTMTEVIGSAGLSVQDLDALSDRFELAVAAAQKMRKRGAVGFWDLPYRRKLYQQVEGLSRALVGFHDIVFLGVGGAIAGCKVMAESLPQHPKSAKSQPRFHFPNTIDPDALSRLVGSLNLKKTAVILVSKSGSSPESLACFFWLEEIMREAVGEKRLPRHFVIATDLEHGPLKEIATDLGCCLVPFPENVGGRFAGLTSIGLLPAAVAGVSIEKVIRAAVRMDQRCKNPSWRLNPALALAGALYLNYTARKRPVWLWVPFAENLEGLVSWCCHLMTESLAKHTDRNGAVVDTGPVQSVGCTGDVYAHLQSLVEGADQQLAVVVSRSKPAQSLRVNGKKGHARAAQYLAGTSLESVFDAERKAFEYTLREKGKPCLALRLGAVEPTTVAPVIFLLQAAVTYLGELQNINIFEQPTAISGKECAASILGSGHGNFSPSEVEKSLRPRRDFMIPV